MVKKLILVMIFFIIIPFFTSIYLTINFLYSLIPQNLPVNIPSSSIASTFSAYDSSLSFASLPTNEDLKQFIAGDEVVAADGRGELVRQFLTKYDSPLEPYSDFIVSMADKYGLDFRLVPAIAMQESNLCKHIPEGSNNCWGFGIYGDKIMKFSTYAEGIETVTKALAGKYKALGLHTPEEIMSRYTPSSNGSWAFGVNHFMEQLQ